MNKIELPKLKYGYKELEPYISEKQLKIHHNIHHSGYVKNMNSILEKLDKVGLTGLKWT